MSVKWGLTEYTICSLTVSSLVPSAQSQTYKGDIRETTKTLLNRCLIVLGWSLIKEQNNKGQLFIHSVRPPWYITIGTFVIQSYAKKWPGILKFSLVYSLSYSYLYCKPCIHVYCFCSCFFFLIDSSKILKSPFTVTVIPGKRRMCNAEWWQWFLFVPSEKKFKVKLSKLKWIFIW